MKSQLNSSPKYSYWSIVAFFGFLGFMVQPTAYTWGEQDMMPFFERIFNSNYLTNDFFTNTTMTKNPRWVYGYFVVALTWLTTLPWYKLLYLLKLLFLTLTPVLYFEVLLVLLRKYIGKNKLTRVLPFVLVSLVAMVFLKEFRYYFSVASWLPYTPALHAYNISIALGFIGILLREHGHHRGFYLPLFFLSCLAHPAMGLFTLAFYIVFLVPRFKKEWRGNLMVLASGIIAVLLVKFVFAAQQTLPTAEFIDIYVRERHPWHYSVVDYSNRKGDWGIFFAGMNLLFLLPIVYGLMRRQRALWQIALAGLLAYSGSIVLQHVFIDIIPSKLIAYMGVSRFTTFGYWMLIVIWGLVLADFIKKGKNDAFPDMGRRYFIFIVVNLIFVGIVFLDNPRETRYKNSKAYYDFIQSTPKDVIFATYSQPLNTDMRLVGQRGVFVSDEFPFAEQNIREYGHRRRLMYGSQLNEQKGTDFYRSLKPVDFIDMAKKYQLDYIVIENSFNGVFGKNLPVWADRKHSIYSVENLRF